MGGQELKINKRVNTRQCAWGAEKNVKTILGSVGGKYFITKNLVSAEKRDSAHGGKWIITSPGDFRLSISFPEKVVMIRFCLTLCKQNQIDLIRIIWKKQLFGLLFRTTRFGKLFQ